MDPNWIGWMMAGSALCWVALAAIAVFAIVRFSPTRERGGDALSVLDQRLSRGGIDAEDYRSRRSLILGQ